MNDAGFDAAAIGSHDFDWGVPVLLSKTGVDSSRRTFIEIWIKGPEDGLFHIDLGTLSEDALWQDGVAPNSRLRIEART